MRNILKNYLIYLTLLLSLGLVACDNSENERLKAELAALKNSAEEKKTIVQGSVTEYGTAPGLTSVRILLAKSELKGILVNEEGVTQEEAAHALSKLTYAAGAAVGRPGLGFDKELFDTAFKLANQVKHVDSGVDGRAYSDRYYSKDYSYIVVSLAIALLKEGLVITDAADTSTGCIIKAHSSKKQLISLPQEYVFIVQPSEHGIHIYGASITKHQFFTFEKPEKSLNKILDKVG